MKINKPSEYIFIEGVTLTSMLNDIKSNRRGVFKEFFELVNNWSNFLADNNRFYQEFLTTNNYATSMVDYSIVRGALINLYNGSSSFEECIHIPKARQAYRGIKCPYCRQGVCSTLDHYFDKDSHCELSLNPWNLVPSCGDCNFKKLNKKIESPNDRFFHPFFDEFFTEGKELCLYYTKIDIYPETKFFTLSLEAHPDLTPRLKSIVNWHMREMDIAKTVGVILRDEFKYWAGKVRKRRRFLNSYESVKYYLQEEYGDEIEFSWRGVSLKSIVSNELNFSLFYEIVTDETYII